VSAARGANDAEIAEVVSIRNTFENGSDWRNLNDNGAARFQTLSFGGEDAKNQALADQRLYEAALSLEPGGLSEWIDSDSGVGFLYCVDKRSGGFIPYEECRDLVLKHY